MTEERGRWNTNRTGGRGRSRSRGWRGRINTPTFFGQARRNQEAGRQAQIEEDVKKDLEYAKSPEVKEMKEKNASMVAKTIERGKGIVDKWFHGFNERVRANVTADFDCNSANRMVNFHMERLEAYTETNTVSEKMKLELGTKMRGMCGFAIAVKLLKSAPEKDRLYLSKFNSLRSTDFQLPKKLMIAIDQIGKTDLGNGMRFRIRNQYMAAKRMLLWSISRYWEQKPEKIKYNDNWTNANVIKFATSNWFINMLFDTRGIGILKDVAKKHWDEVSNKTNYQLHDLLIRLPAIVDTEEDPITVEKVVEYLKMKIFSEAKGTTDYAKLVSCLVVRLAKENWLKTPDKTLSELESKFKETFIADITLYDVIKELGLKYMDEIISEENLNDAGIELLSDWNERVAPKLNHVFDMTKSADFSEYGSDAQVVEILSGLQPAKSSWDYTFLRYPKKPDLRSKLRISDFGAVIGSAFGYTTDVRMKTGYDIMIGGSIDEIVSDFFKSDVEGKA